LPKRRPGFPGRLLSLVQMESWKSHLGLAPRPDRAPDDCVRSRIPTRGCLGRSGEGAITNRDFLSKPSVLRTFLRPPRQGAHVVLPLTRRPGWDEVKLSITQGGVVAYSIVAAETQENPSKMPNAGPQGEGYLDYQKRPRRHHSIAPLPTPPGPASPSPLPLFWDGAVRPACEPIHGAVGTPRPSRNLPPCRSLGGIRRPPVDPRAIKKDSWG